MTTHTFIEQNAIPEPARNERTQVVSLRRILPSVETRLASALGPFLSFITASRVPGMVAALVDAHGRLARSAMMRLDGARVCTLIVGRHSHADLRIDDEELALRHAAIVYDAATPDSVRAFDLRAGTPLRDRDGVEVGAAIARLPAVFQVGKSLLLVAVTPSPPLVSLTGGCAPIVTAQERTPFTFRMDGHTEAEVMSFVPREAARAWALMGREPTAEHTLSGARPASCVFRPRWSELARGVLIGRYPRCDVPVEGVWSNALSRVHALLFAAETGVYLADLASSAGVVHETRGLTRLKHVQVGDVFRLGDCRLKVMAS